MVLKGYNTSNSFLTVSVKQIINKNKNQKIIIFVQKQNLSEE